MQSFFRKFNHSRLSLEIFITFLVKDCSRRGLVERTTWTKKEEGHPVPMILKLGVAQNPIRSQEPDVTTKCTAAICHLPSKWLVALGFEPLASSKRLAFDPRDHCHRVQWFVDYHFSALLNEVAVRSAYRLGWESDEVSFNFDIDWRLGTFWQITEFWLKIEVIVANVVYHSVDRVTRRIQ